MKVESVMKFDLSVLIIFISIVKYMYTRCNFEYYGFLDDFNLYYIVLPFRYLKKFEDKLSPRGGRV